MKYYKDENNQIYAYEDYVPESMMKEGLTAITEKEAMDILNPKKTDDEIKAEIIAINTDKQLYLTKEANTAIAILQDAFDLDMQEDGDEERLKAWRKYRILLSRIDLSIENVDWPVKPT